jgi:hypothetical protein
MNFVAILDCPNAKALNSLRASFTSVRRAIKDLSDNLAPYELSIESIISTC